MWRTGHKRARNRFDQTFGAISIPVRLLTVPATSITRTLTCYDIFNGDADGLCALRQLRLDDPRESQLVTGTKRETALVARIVPHAGDKLTVLDVSMDRNRDALLHALAAGASCLYFDHHYPGAVPDHPRLESHIQYVANVCTSLIVDEFLSGRHRAWAVAAAFGDNLPEEAQAAARSMRLDKEKVATLRTIGECLNYNAYGETEKDLHFPPAELYRRLAKFVDPIEFASRDPAFEALKLGYEQDMALAATVDPLTDTVGGRVTVLPAEPWSRRVSGAWANHMATSDPRRAHAVLVRQTQGYTVSVRAPLARPSGADLLCRQFAQGGGRPAAAGINGLPENELQRFVTEFERAYPDRVTSP